MKIRITLLLIVLFGLKVIQAKETGKTTIQGFVTCLEIDGQHYPEMSLFGSTLNFTSNTLDVGDLPVSHLTGITNLSGTPMTISKIAMGTVTPNTSEGYSIDISGVGFTTVTGCSVVAVENGNVSNDIPFATLKTISNTAIVVNITDGQAGLGMTFADVTGVTLRVVVYGN